MLGEALVEGVSDEYGNSSGARGAVGPIGPSGSGEVVSCGVDGGRLSAALEPAG